MTLLRAAIYPLLLVLLVAWAAFAAGVWLYDQAQAKLNSMMKTQ